jgi:hypothetical protein
MMNDVDIAVARITSVLESAVDGLSRYDYREVLEELACEIGARIDGIVADEVDEDK